LFIGAIVGIPNCHAQFSPPQNSLGAANAYGYLQIWRDIDEVDFGKGLTLPLAVRFSSERQQPSPYFGSGWWCPLLEARAYLKREKMLRAELPCGQVIYLRQSKTDPNIYESLDKKLAAVIDKDKGDITLSGSCCGEYRYRHGRLTQIKTPEGRLITLFYNGNLVTEIREEGSSNAPFKLTFASEGIPNGMYVNGRLHGFELGKRPQVENVGGNNVVSGFEQSLAIWRSPDGKTEFYQYEVNSDLSPNLKMIDRNKIESHFTWEVTTGHIVSEGDWRYAVGQVSGQIELPTLRRANSKNEVEFRYVDIGKGITEVKSVTQGHTITEVFKSPGPLYDKVRKVENVENESKKLVYRASYSEAGQILRELDEKGFTLIYQYAEDGKLTKRLEPPTDKSSISLLREQEGVLLSEINNAINAVAKDAAMQRLGFFYIKEARDKKKAVELLSKITNPLHRFNLKLHMIESDQITDLATKINLLKELLDEFPEKETIISALLSAHLEQQKIEKKSYE
jgi:hypothetical protein